MNKAPDSKTARPAAKPNWSSRLSQAEKLLADDDLKAAGRSLAELAKVRAKLDKSQQKKLAMLEEVFQGKLKEAADAERTKTLAEAEAALAEGRLEQATAALENVLAADPTEEQQAAAGEMRDKIEDMRKVQRELRSALRLLASTKRSDVRTARTQLWEEPEAALPLLLGTLESDDPLLVGNVLELLRMFNQPERTLPPTVAILTRPSQSACWPVVIRELQKMPHAGAGLPLLTLATAAGSVEQRTAALTALAGVSDPPPRTLVDLLPLIYQDGPELTAALQAAYHAVEVHRQGDLAARRGLDGEISSEQEGRLLGLADRLSAIMSAAPSDSQPNESARAAMTLAVATRQIIPQPLMGVSVVRASGEIADSPAVAVLDGVWSLVNPKSMWRHPIDKPGSIVFDLGAERTVTGVRVWNYNEQSLAYRGWKDLDVYVSSSPSLLDPVAEGIVPQAPGAAADTTDYSVLIQVPLVRGRYLKLQSKSQWRPDTLSGLTEVQLLGF